MIFKVARLLGLICCLRLVLTLNLSCYEISFLKNNGKRLWGLQVEECRGALSPQSYWNGLLDLIWLNIWKHTKIISLATMQGDSALRYMYIGDNYGTECVIRFDFRHLLLSIEQKRCTCRKHTSPRRPLVHLNNKFEEKKHECQIHVNSYIVSILSLILQKIPINISIYVSSICHYKHVYIIYITYLYISVTRSNLNLKIFFKSAIF